MDTKEIKEVVLQTKDHKEGEARKQTFKPDHALALLKRSNSQWELETDSNYKFNGTDLSVKTEEDKKADSDAKKQK